MATKGAWIRKAIIGSTARVCKAAKGMFKVKAPAPDLMFRAVMDIPGLNMLARGGDRMLKLLGNFFMEEVIDLGSIIISALFAPAGLAVTLPAIGQWISKLVVKNRLAKAYYDFMYHSGLTWTRPITEISYFHGAPNNVQVLVAGGSFIPSKINVTWWDSFKPWPMVEGSPVVGAAVSGYGITRFMNLFDGDQHASVFIPPHNYSNEPFRSFGRFIMANFSHLYPVRHLRGITGSFKPRAGTSDQQMLEYVLSSTWANWATSNGVGYDLRKVPGVIS